MLPLGVQRMIMSRRLQICETILWTGWASLLKSRSRYKIDTAMCFMGLGQQAGRSGRRVGSGSGGMASAGIVSMDLKRFIPTNIKLSGL